MISNRYQYIFFFIIFIAALVLMYWVVNPYIPAIFIAFVCAVIFKGYHEKLEKIAGNKNVAAALSVISVILLIVLPLCLVGTVVFFEANAMYSHLSAGGASTGVMGSLTSRAVAQIHMYFPNLNLDFQSYLKSGLNWLITNTSTLFTSFLKFLLDLLIMLFGLFYLFRDGKKLHAYFITLSPLDEQDDVHILKRLELTINSVMKGSIIVGIIQGTLTGIGLWIFGVPAPALWGLVAAFASLIPGIGTSIVAVPALIFLFLSNNIFGTVGYAIWASLVVALVDNFISPQIINIKVNIHPFLILISALGGIAFFGPIGFIAGPISLAFAVELLKLYPKFIQKMAPNA